MQEEKENRKFGYARVSSRGQNLDRQLAALRQAGIPENHIFTDRQSGKDFNRPNYLKMLRKLRKGDELFVESVDRLGRNYDEILEQWKTLTKQKQVQIIVLDFPLLDTRKNRNGVTGEFLADLVLRILSYVAQVERENIHQRQMEGIREARKRGVRFGRPLIKKPEGYREVATAVGRHDVSLRAGAKQLGISHTTLRHWMSQESGHASGNRMAPCRQAEEKWK